MNFEVVCWPESQMYMELDGWEDNSYLVNDEHGLDDFGSSAYFVNSEWLKNANDKLTLIDTKRKTLKLKEV